MYVSVKKKHYILNVANYYNNFKNSCHKFDKYIVIITKFVLSQLKEPV